MKILFLTDNYPPEVNAPATRTHFHCREWVRSGVDVTVITCAPNFPSGRVFDGYSNQLYAEEWLEGVRIVRVWSYMAPNAGFAKRVLDYVSYAACATVAGLVEDFDLVVATSPQFFTAVAGRCLSVLKRTPWVFEVRDMWPESIVATGAMKQGFVISALERLELDLYRSANRVVPVTHSFVRQIVNRGVSAERLCVIPNGVDLSDFERVARLDPEGAAQPRSVFRIGYLGTHGMAHGLDLVFRTAALLRGQSVEFVLVGDGAEKPRLQAEAHRLGLPNVRLAPPVPREQVPEVMNTFDAALVPLRDRETFRSVIPSKIFEAAAAGIPILLGVRGEAEALVRRYEAGVPFTPEDEYSLADAIQRLAHDRELYRRCVAGARALAESYDRRQLAEAMLRELKSVVAGSSE